jgi:hypothetical protein
MQETKLTLQELCKLGAKDDNYLRYKLGGLYIVWSKPDFFWILADEFYRHRIKPEDEKITTVEQLKRVYGYLNVELPRQYNDIKNKDIFGMLRFNNIFDFISKYDEVNFKLLVSLRRKILIEQGFDVSGINFELYAKVLEEKFKRL